MHTIWIIARRELSTFFDSLTAYVLLVIFLGLSGFFTWAYGADIFLVGQISLQPFFSVAYWTLFFFIPALTMKMLSEEKRNGTIELLQTKSVTDWQIIIGKFLGCILLIVITLLFTLPYYFTLNWLGKPDHGAILCGYLGLILMSSALAGIGMFASSITPNQIAAFLLSLLVGLFFIIIFDVLAGNLSGGFAQVLYFLSLSTHFESISRGVIDVQDIVYFLSVAFVGMAFAEYHLSKRQSN